MGDVVIWLASYRFLNERQPTCWWSLFDFSATILRPAGLLSLFCIFLLFNVVIERADGFTPDSPQVRVLIDKGKQILAGRRESQLGGKCVTAMVFVKDGQPDHAKVAEAVAACQELAKQTPEEIGQYREVYSLGLSIIFLCELDPLIHRPTIDRLLAGLYERHRVNKSSGQNGGFGYVGRGTGDTSMTQYGVLALWTAHRSGIEVPGDVIKDVSEWLLRTQDPSGAWGYQGNYPGPNSNRVEQKEIRSSMVAAGLGSMYVLSDLIGLNKFLKTVGTEVPDIPPALIPVPTESSLPVAGMASRGLAIRFKRALSDGDEWLKSNFEIAPDKYTFYYLYALERCQSFRELAWKLDVKEPSWYNQGVRYISESERASGGWRSIRNGHSTDTAFAVLFLMRSSKKSIQRSLGSGSGLLVGGRGLPSDVSNVRLQGGRLVSTAINIRAAELLGVLEDPDHPDLEKLLNDPSIVLLDGDGSKREEQLRRFRRLVRSDDYRIRRLAVRTLARHRDLDSVVYLIYAISDPDSQVSWTAREGLRFISRNLFGISAVRGATAEQKVAIAAKWKNWYSAIRPDVRFLD